MTSGRIILITALISESVLVLLWYLAKISGLIPALTHNHNLTESIIITIASLIVLILINYIFFYKFPVNQADQFLTNFVKPICQSLSLPAALIVSVAAGVGEELFFRSFLLVYLSDLLSFIPALFASSLLFAYLHFISKAKEYFLIFLIYIFVGGIFGLIHQLSGSDILPIIVHASYDFLAICYVKHKYSLDKI